MSTFQFGAHAIHTPESEPHFNERRDSIVESILAEELLHASWDRERARETGDTRDNGISATQLAGPKCLQNSGRRSTRQAPSLPSRKTTATVGPSVAVSCPVQCHTPAGCWPIIRLGPAKSEPNANAPQRPRLAAAPASPPAISASASALSASPASPYYS